MDTLKEKIWAKYFSLRRRKYDTLSIKERIELSGYFLLINSTYGKLGDDDSNFYINFK